MNEITSYKVASAQIVAEYIAKKFLSEHFLTEDGKYMFPVKMDHAGSFEYSDDPKRGLHITITHEIHEEPINPDSQYMVKKHYYFIHCHVSGQPPEYKGVKSPFSKELTQDDLPSLYPTGYRESYPGLFRPNFAKTALEKATSTNKPPDSPFTLALREIYTPFMEDWGNEDQLKEMLDLSKILNTRNSKHFDNHFFQLKIRQYKNDRFATFTANDYINFLKSMVDEKRGGKSRKRGQKKTKKRRGQKKSKKQQRK
jgi:hypothetical protein